MRGVRDLKPHNRLEKEQPMEENTTSGMKSQTETALFVDAMGRRVRALFP